MTATHKNEIYVGLLVVLGITALLGMTFIVRGNTGMNPYHVRVVYTNVAGLDIGSPVLVSGFRLGRVVKMEPLRNEEGDPMVVVFAKVGRTIPIYRDAVVKLSQQGFLGDMRLEIHPGNENSGEIQPGDTLTSEPPMDLSVVFDSAGAIVADVQATISGVRELVTDRERIASFDRVLLNVERASGEIATTLEDNRELLRTTLVNIEEVTRQSAQLTERADRILADVEGRVGPIGDQATEAIEELRADARRLVERVDRIGADAEAVVGEGRRTMEELSVRATEVADNLNQLLGTINEGRGTVGRLLNDPRPFNDLQESIAALRTLLMKEQSNLYDRKVPYRMGAAVGAASGPVGKADGTDASNP